MYKLVLLILWGILCAPLSGLAQIHIKCIQGNERLVYLKEVSNFYNAFYRDPPYYYDHTVEAWDRYMHSYIDEPESILCMAFQDEILVGAAIGTPLAKTTQKYKAAFADHPEDINSLFFLGELGIKSPYQQQGIEKLLYAEFEEQVVKKNQFSEICVWQLQSEINHSGAFWRDLGYTPSKVYFEELWKETLGTEKVPHSMVCWKKQL